MLRRIKWSLEFYSLRNELFCSINYCEILLYCAVSGYSIVEAGTQLNFGHVFVANGTYNGAVLKPLHRDLGAVCSV